jgi:phosphoglycolate phosphatase-like HAD superfamily hydrolase
MVPALKELKKAGFSLGIITSNSEKNVKNFLEINEIFDIFDFIHSGRNLFGKDKVIKQLFKKKKIAKNSIIYVGDETRDIEMAKKIGIPIIAVSWGFNAKEILGALGPNKMIDNPKDLLECVKKT